MLEDNVKYIGPTSVIDKYHNYKQTKFIITDNCNYKCDYCPSHLEKPIKFTSIDKLLKITAFIKMLHEEYPREVSLFGGEPTIHPQFLDIMDACTFAYRLLLTTNLSCSLDKLEQIIKIGKKANYFQVCASYQTKAKFDEFKEKINLLVKNKVTTWVLLMLTPYNFDDIFRINNYFKLYKTVSPTFKVYINRVFYSKYDNVFTKEQLSKYENYYKDLDDTDKWVYYHYNDDSIKRYTYDYILQLNGGNYKGWHCMAGNEYLAFDYDGDVYPCKGYRKEGFKPLFNIFDDDINKCKDILKQVEKGIICDCEYKCLVNQVPRYSPKFYDFNKEDFYDCSNKCEEFCGLKGLNSYGSVEEFC